MVSPVDAVVRVVRVVLVVCVVLVLGVVNVVFVVQVVGVVSVIGVGVVSSEDAIVEMKKKFNAKNLNKHHLRNMNLIRNAYYAEQTDTQMVKTVI